MKSTKKAKGSFSKPGKKQAPAATSVANTNAKKAATIGVKKPTGKK